MRNPLKFPKAESQFAETKKIQSITREDIQETFTNDHKRLDLSVGKEWGERLGMTEKVLRILQGGRIDSDLTEAEVRVLIETLGKKRRKELATALIRRKSGEIKTAPEDPSIITSLRNIVKELFHEKKEESQESGEALTGKTKELMLNMDTLVAKNHLQEMLEEERDFTADDLLRLAKTVGDGDERLKTLLFRKGTTSIRDAVCVRMLNELTAAYAASFIDGILTQVSVLPYCGELLVQIGNETNSLLLLRKIFCKHGASGIVTVYRSPAKERVESFLQRIAHKKETDAAIAEKALTEEFGKIFNTFGNNLILETAKFEGEVYLLLMEGVSQHEMDELFSTVDFDSRNTREYIDMLQQDKGRDVPEFFRNIITKKLIHSKKAPTDWRDIAKIFELLPKELQTELGSQMQQASADSAVQAIMVLQNLKKESPAWALMQAAEHVVLSTKKTPEQWKLVMGNICLFSPEAQKALLEEFKGDEIDVMTIVGALFSARRSVADPKIVTELQDVVRKKIFSKKGAFQMWQKAINTLQGEIKDLIATDMQEELGLITKLAGSIDQAEQKRTFTVLIAKNVTYKELEKNEAAKSVIVNSIRCGEHLYEVMRLNPEIFNSEEAVNLLRRFPMSLMQAEHIARVYKGNKAVIDTLLEQMKKISKSTEDWLRVYSAVRENGLQEDEIIREIVVSVNSMNDLCRLWVKMPKEIRANILRTITAEGR